MAKQAKLRAVLSLDDVAFARGIRHAITMSRDLAKQFAKNPFKTTFLAGALAARKAVQVTARGLEIMGSVARKAFKVATVGALAAGVALAGITAKSIGVAAQFEQIEVGFKVFLGTAEKARDRMKELVAFAAKTPFQVPEIAEASKTLQVLTKGMLATGKGLELVGDVASATNRSFAETAVTVGRLFAALRSGVNPGQELASMRDSGALSPEAVRKIGAMAGVDGAAAWRLAQKELGKFSGMMKEQAGTWNGLMSTFHDSVLTALAAFGAPIIDNLKPALKELTDVVFSVAPKLADMGKKFGEGLRVGIDFLKGLFDTPASAVDPLVHALKAGFLTAGNALIYGVKAALSVAPQIVSVLADGFIGLQQIISGSLMKAFAGPVEYLTAGIQSAVEKANAFQAKLDDATMPGGSPEMNAHRKAISDLGERTRANDDRLREKYGIKVGSLNDRASMDAYTKEKELFRQANPQPTSPTVGRSAAEIQAANGSFAGDAGDDQIKQGQARIAEGSKKFFDAVAKALKNVSYQDVLGAQAEAALAKAGVAKVAKAGRKFSSKLKEAREREENAAREKAIRDGYNENSFVYKGGGGLTSGGLRSTGGLSTSGLSSGAHRTVNSLLSLSERRKASQAVRAAEIGERYMKTGRFTAGGALGAVRSGDRRAATAYVRDKQREKLGLEKTNAILENLERKFDQAWIQGGGGAGK